MVAFVIAAAALAVLYGAGITGLESARSAARYGQALSRAESHLAVAALGPDYAPGDRQGDEGGGYHWRVRIQPVATAPGPDRTRPVPALYAIAVAVSWTERGHTRSVTLETRRTGTAPPAPP